jgi:hypothetical protein
MPGPLKDAPMALSAEGIWAGSCSIEQRSSTPGGCDNPGPSLTPSTGDALPPFGARAETFFSDGVPPYVLKTEGMPQKEAEARTQSPTPIGQTAVPVALPGPSTDGDQQPSSSAATNLSDQPAASFQEPALENFAEAMFASGLGEPVFIGGDFGDVEQTKEVVLAAGDAVLSLVEAYADRREALARKIPTVGPLDKVEMLGYLLGRVLCGRLLSWQEAEPLGKAAGKMVFGKRTVATLQVALAEAKKAAGRRAGKDAPEDAARRAAIIDEARDAVLRQPAGLTLPAAPARKRKRSPLCPAPIPCAPVSTPVVAPTPIAATGYGQG